MYTYTHIQTHTYIFLIKIIIAGDGSKTTLLWVLPAEMILLPLLQSFSGF